MTNKIITMTCPSGARVVLEKDENAPYVAFSFNVFKGAAAETPENFGVAHFLEHMMFKSSQKYNVLEISEKMEALGAEMNASTSSDITAYHFRCLPESFAGCAEIFGDMLSNPLFLEDEFNSEKNVILEEINASNDNPSRVAFMGMHTAMMSNFVPHAHAVLGKREDVQKLTPAHLREFMEKHYLGSNITFSVVGNLDLLDVTKVLRQHFGKYFGGKGLVSGQEKNIWPIPQKQAVAIPRDINQVKLYIGFAGPDAKEDERFTAILFNRVFGRGFSSRLYVNIRENKGLAYSISSHYYAMHKFGYIMVGAGVSPQNLEITKKEIFKVLHDMAQNGITEEEFARAKMTFKSQNAFDKDDREEVCQDNAEDDHLYGHVLTDEEINAKIETVSKEDIQSFAQKLLRSRISISACGPNIKEEQLKINVCQQDLEK